MSSRTVGGYSMMLMGNQNKTSFILQLRSITRKSSRKLSALPVSTHLTKPYLSNIGMNGHVQRTNLLHEGSKSQGVVASTISRYNGLESQRSGRIYDIMAHRISTVQQDRVSLQNAIVSVRAALHLLHIWLHSSREERFLEHL